MANLKSLVKDTAIYGISSIAGRFINYLLVPIQTAAFAASGGEYGVVTNIYAYTALLLVLLTYGMETTFSVMSTRPGKTLGKSTPPRSSPWAPRRCFSSSLCWPSCRR